MNLNLRPKEECAFDEISLGEISVGRVFPSPLEMTTIKRTLGLA